MIRSSVRLISIFLSLLLISSLLILSTEKSYALPAGTYHDIDDNRTIRVAQIDLSNFYDYDRKGPIGGYGFEYLEKIASYTGWKYEFVPVTRERGLEMLESGEIDLMAPLVLSDDLEGRYDFSGQEIGLNYTVLCVAIEDSQTAYNDFSAIDGMKVGMLAKDTGAKKLVEYQQEHGFKTKTIPFDNQAALLKALHDGKLDAILTTSLEKRPTERIVARFSPEPYYIITAKGRNDILIPLNDALSAIKSDNPYYDYELQKKYYAWEEQTVPIFSRAEKEYIKNAGILKVVYDPVWAPIEYYDEETGKFSGINADIFQLISEMTGLRFSFVRTDSYAESLRQIADYEADILTGIDNDIHWANQHNLMLSDPYLVASIVLVKNERVHDLTNVTAALAQDYLAATEYVKKTNSHIKIRYYDSPRDCFEAVNRGEADITYANSYVAEQLMENPRFNMLSIVETVNLEDRLCIGLSDSLDPVLLSILNKSIHSITDTQLNSIIFEHTVNQQPEINLQYVLYNNPRFLFLFMLGIFLASTSVMIIIILIKNRHNRDMKKIAYLDSVTGTWNYNKFKVDAYQLLKNAKNREYAIAYLDIYRFSYINDTFGYKAGDTILSEVARELQAAIKETEATARLAADNFVCLLEYEDDNAIVERGKIFQQRCDERLSKVNSRYKVYFTTAIYKVRRGEADIPALVGKADLAHKTLNDARKSSMVFYNDQIRKEFLRRKNLESDMAASLNQGNFQIYFQPKFDLSSGGLVGMEALTRWLHPTEGLITPVHFISLFESNGFILELDFYVYEKVCRILRNWMDEGKEVLPVSVNVSRAHLTNHQFGAHLKALTDQYGIDPGLIELELTESILLDNTEEAVSLIQELKSLGFPIHIDDFGSGYSSLNLLKDLAAIVDVLKLDKEFFRKGSMNEKDKTIVKGIIRIARELNLRILSEGVETREQAEFLISSGCHMAQGYYYARPMPVEEFENMKEIEIGEN